MKKNFFAIVSAVLLLAAVSCTKEKEGVYNPSLKISSIYQDYNVYHGSELEWNIPKYLAEQWVWKENRLERIRYFDTETYGDVDSICAPVLLYTQDFTYDNKNRLTRADVVFSDFGLTYKDSSFSIYATYEYDGKYLKNINLYENGVLALGYEFTHDGSTISAITVIINGGELFTEYGRILDRINPLRFVLAPEVAERALSATQDCAKKINSKGESKSIYAVTFNTEWDSDNLTRLLTDKDNMMGLFSLEFTFTYDTYTNPYYGLFDASGAFSSANIVPFMAMGRNNVTAMTMKENLMGENISETVTYTYTYNKSGVPETKSMEETDDTLGSDSYRYVTTYYYQY